jgi:uncharacterized membrane protein YobD (UPF0266 family)
MKILFLSLFIYSALSFANIKRDAIMKIRMQKTRINVELNKVTEKYNNARIRCLSNPAYCAYAKQYKKKGEIIKKKKEMFDSLYARYKDIDHLSQDEIRKKLSIWREANRSYLRNYDGLPIEERYNNRRRWNISRSVPGY